MGSVRFVVKIITILKINKSAVQKAHSFGILKSILQRVKMYQLKIRYLHVKIIIQIKIV